MADIKKTTLEDSINYLFILYAFLVPISRAGLSFLTAILFLLWLFSDNFKKRVDFLKSDKTVIYLVAFIALSILSLLWSDNVSSGIEYIRRYWYFLVLFVIASTIQKKFIEYAVSAFLAGMLLSEIISYGVFFELWSFKRATVEFPNPFMNHIQYSMLLAFTSLLLLNKIFYDQNIKLKVLYSLFFLTTTANLFLNSGRTGQVAFALSIFVVGFLNIKNKIMAFFAISTLVISIFYAAYQISPNFKERVHIGMSDINKIIDNKDYCASIGLRVGAWIVGGEIFLDNPILGIGSNGEMDVLKEYISKNHQEMECVKEMPSYHNFYIQTAVHLGIIGLFFYIMIFYNLLRINIRDKFYFNLTALFVTVYSVSSLVENMFHAQFPIAFFALFGGIFIAQNRIENEI
ncbi:MAG: O-antigen ligase family protein [Sulfurimonas sp.]|jgi:O-antigen ligase|uniref:O-antigen ligase family protein n=2 Tax=unclassified Sulfurimonas TaxID=2623549 RepID=UPI0035667595